MQRVQVGVSARSGRRSGGDKRALAAAAMPAAQAPVPGSLFVPKPYGARRPAPGQHREIDRGARCGVTCAQRDPFGKLRPFADHSLLFECAARKELLEPVDVIIPIDDFVFPRQGAEQR